MADENDKREFPTRIHFATVSEMYFGTRRLDAGKFDPSRPLPWIPVHGQWLEHAGFKIDDHVELEISARKVVITLV